jgi:hypothetical protein
VFRIATTAWLPSVIVTHPRAMWNEAQDNEETKPSPFPECGRCHCLTVGPGSQNSQAIPPNGRDWFTANNASSNLVETPRETLIKSSLSTASTDKVVPA